MQTVETPESAPRKTRARTTPEKASQSKKDLLIELLRAKGGANVQQLSETLGWLHHTVRAALTGLRKSGIAVEKLPAREGERTRYRINARRARSA